MAEEPCPLTIRQSSGPVATIQRIASLDARVSSSLARAPWCRVEVQAALVTATRETGSEAVLGRISSARIGVSTPVHGEAGCADLDARARLRLLERHLAFVTRALAGVRRPAALQRTVAVSLARWGKWAAQLARITGTDLSTAFRSLEQAAQPGLVVEVPQQRRGRGNLTLYAAPPWLMLPGLISVPRGRPAAVNLSGDAAEDRLDAVMADIDALLAGMDERLDQVAGEAARG